MTERYTITAADAAGCREIVAELEKLDAKLGGFRVGAIQGHAKSATATVHYERGADPITTSEAIARALNSLPLVELLAKKIVCHYDTHLTGEAGNDD